MWSGRLKGHREYFVYFQALSGVMGAFWPVKTDMGVEFRQLKLIT